MARKLRLKVRLRRMSLQPPYANLRKARGGRRNVGYPCGNMLGRVAFSAPAPSVLESDSSLQPWLLSRPIHLRFFVSICQSLLHLAILR